MSQSQRKLFSLDVDPWELDDQTACTVASVVFPEGVENAYQYEVPAELVDRLSAGQRVRVPLGRGNRTCIGYCVQVEAFPAPNQKLKSIHSVIDPTPLASGALLHLTRWMADYYLTSWGKVLESVIPAAVRIQAGTRKETFYSVPTHIVARMTQLKLPTKQAAVLKTLATSTVPMTADQIASIVKCTAAPIRGLVKKGLLQTDVRRVSSMQEQPIEAENRSLISMNSHQQEAVETIVQALRTGRHETLLLHGVTGSGKTEVYIRSIEEVIQYGRQAIVLVPEISLTPQTRRRFQSRFSKVAVLHSHLSDGERNWHWNRIARGDVDVVVGARSAVFAPTPQLGLIVIDEEHDGSFKQDQLPRYHARDVAAFRAQTERVPLILGSATPSLESWHQAQTAKYRLVSLPHRVLDLPLPDVVTIDQRNEYRGRAFSGSISRPLQQAIKMAIGRNEQVILMLNRRGFSTHIQCPACGEVVRCPACDLALTHHREGDRAICHYCDYQINAPPVCPACQFEGIRYSGLGTQRLEAEVRSRFADATCLRMDSDTMRRHGSHEASLARFRNGEIQILVGTQMIAKGLDFPNVTVVGVINADTALHLPDFRAAERTFQLVTQVAGRTGRGRKGGRVFLQTFNPDHFAIRAAERHDYRQFASVELPIREQFKYPPFGCMTRVIVRGSHETRTAQLADSIADFLRAGLAGVGDFRLLGPAPAPIQKIRGKFRFHLIVQTATMVEVKSVLREAQSHIKSTDEARWIADVDPLDML